MTTRDKLFGFQGRLRRSDWWVWSLSLILVHTCLAAATLTILEPDRLASARSPISYFISAAAYLPVGASAALEALFLWPVLALGVKRMHDQGQAGWSVVALNAFAISLTYIPPSFVDWFDDALPTAVGFAIAAVIVCGILWVLFGLAFLDGTPGPNRYGPSPKADPGAAPTA